MAAKVTTTIIIFTMTITTITDPTSCLANEVGSSCYWHWTIYYIGYFLFFKNSKNKSNKYIKKTQSYLLHIDAAAGWEYNQMKIYVDDTLVL